jgi:hypothetical protein
MSGQALHCPDKNIAHCLIRRDKRLQKETTKLPLPRMWKGKNANEKST